MLSVRLRQHDPRDRKRQNYPAFKMPDGSVPVLEATVVLHSPEHPDWKDMTIGIPLAMLEQPEGEHEVVLNFSGVRWTMYVDGELLDNDFPFGYPHWAAKNTWKLDAEYVKKAALYLPGITPEKKPAQTPARRARPVLDSAGTQHLGRRCGDDLPPGRYHVFYLYDRRHHKQVRQGRALLRTPLHRGLQDWTEHEAATPLEEQWECIGTGTPFVFNDKLCLSYGLHTDAHLPAGEDDLARAMGIPEKQRTHGRVQARRSTRRARPARPTPSARTASRTSRSRRSCSTPARTPASIRDPERQAADAGQRRVQGHVGIGIGGRRLALHQSRTSRRAATARSSSAGASSTTSSAASRDLWSKPADAPDSAYEDVVRKGLDFYDGLNVPSITEIPGGRFLMAGWIPIRGWGGNLVIRELLQFPDGRIGSKWMDGDHARNGEAQDARGERGRNDDLPGRQRIVPADLPCSARRGEERQARRFVSAGKRRAGLLRTAGSPG